ncbi:MAG: phosphate ABC transporter permease subunit PstC [Pseudomonadota bacterium]|nr:phosphate ABC transporter permease subunit PstC [Gammaproteobacteria bacterium]MDQ3583010.1 phosphate ABC transporter permease subunit PstC [Pseudomonadota bacterium]
MQPALLALVLLVLTSIGYYLGRGRSLRVANGSARVLHSLPSYYGFYTALWCGIPALLLLAAWLLLEPAIVTRLVVADLPSEMRELPEARRDLLVNDIENVLKDNITRDADPGVLAAAERYRHLQGLSAAALAVAVLSLALVGGTVALRSIRVDLRARNRVEVVIRVLLITGSTIAIFTTIGIVLSVLFEAIRFFQKVPITEFLFGLKWSPQVAIRADQVGGSGAFGAVPLFTGTLLISGIAMAVAVPIGLMSAIYLSEYASRGFRTIAKPVLEVLAGIPTVVYGFFAALVVAPLIRDTGTAIGLDVSSESALAAGLVMGIMIIPFVSSLADDVINAVPQALRDGSYGIGATRSETIRQVVIPAALPGIVGGVLLAVSRAIGETMIVVMAAGLAANLTMNPLEAVTTVTVQIVTVLVGDQEFDSAKTLSAFALGLVLFVLTLVLNIIALHMVRKYREQYE